MSLQDDYFGLEDELEGENLLKFRRIWFAYCNLETQKMVLDGELSQESYEAWFVIQQAHSQEKKT